MVTGFVPTDVVSNDNVTVEPGDKLIPETVTEEPAPPLVGLSNIAGLFDRVNCAKAELDDASVALTVCAPPADAGTVNVAVKLPPELVVMVAGEVGTDVPSYDILITELGAKVLPETVTEEPAPPLVGFSNIAGLLDRVICAKAELDDASVALTV